MTNAFRPTTVDHLLALEEIRLLTLRYSYCVDTRRSEDLISLFTEDAVWDSTDNGHGRIEGREAFRRFFRGPDGLITMIHHMIGSPLVTELGDDEASGIITYTGQVNFTGTEYVVLEAGRYNDRYVRTPEGWRIKARVLEHVFPSRRLDIVGLTAKESLPDVDDRLG